MTKHLGEGFQHYLEVVSNPMMGLGSLIRPEEYKNLLWAMVAYSSLAGLTEMAEAKAKAEALVPKFKLERILNQDQAGRRTSLYGQIDSQPALLILERAPFPSTPAHISDIPSTLARLQNLGANDIYSWFMARSGGETPETDFVADLKINLIYPCTETHIKKYSKQGVRFVIETPEIYKEKIRPYMLSKREQGRLNWVFNIIEGRKEVEDVIYRTKLGEAGDEGFLLLPDLNWDRKTLDALHLLALVERRDIWSLRDLKKKHIPWLKHMKAKLLAATCETYPSIEPDQLKFGSDAGDGQGGRVGEYHGDTASHGRR
ncbi:Fc.00g088790.m01.CDS01 [Cosmosporella sp. VM-42]